MNGRKRMFLFLFVLLFVFSVCLVTACNSARRPGPVEPAPTPSPSPMDQTGENTQAGELAEKVSELPQINSATVVLSGDKAWVGVDLAAKMENKMTEEMKDEITALIKKEKQDITTVYVTADADTVTRLRNISKDIAHGQPLSGFADELTEMGRRITPSAK